MQRPARPKKLDREATRTAVASCRFGSKADREVKSYAGPEPERGPCEVFDRGAAMSKAIAKAARRGRAIQVSA